jgi:adenylate cyclase
MTTEQRRLAAILLADVVGYSRLMGEDERNTLTSLRSLRTEILEPKFREHGGRLVKTMGDGFLVEFGSAVNAVGCAVEVQEALEDRAAGREVDRGLRLRIGINVGDIVVEGDDIFGDGVNVAARLQSIAQPGSICVSKVVADQLRGRLDARLDALGPQHVKNIAQPVEAYRVVPHRAIAAGASTVFARAPVGRAHRFRKPLWIAALFVGIAIAGLAIVKLATLYAPTRGNDAPALSVAVMPFVAYIDDADARRAAEALSRDVKTTVSRDTTGNMGARLRLVSSDRPNASEVSDRRERWARIDSHHPRSACSHGNLRRPDLRGPPIDSGIGACCRVFACPPGTQASALFVHQTGRAQAGRRSAGVDPHGARTATAGQ